MIHKGDLIAQPSVRYDYTAITGGLLASGAGTRTATFTVIDVAQRSPEWFAARAGRLTGSAAADMLAEIKSGEAASRRNLRARLVVERLTGVSQEDGYTNAAMQWGLDHEAEALAAYEAETGELVQTTGFLACDDVQAGCSLDGHIDADFNTLVSIKCPLSATHLSYLKAGVFPPAYVPQMLHELWVTGAKAYHFLSFDPRFPPHLQRCLYMLLRDDAAVDAYAKKALVFLAEVDAEIAALQTIRNLAGTLEAAAR